MSTIFRLQRDIQEIQRELDDMRQELRILRRNVSRSQFKSGRLPPIPKPRQVTAASNVVGALRRQIDLLNQSQDLGSRYDQFTSDDAILNRQLKKMIGTLLKSYIGECYGNMTWYQASLATNIESCEEVINAASELEEFRVLAQTADLWAIRLLADAKMRTALRDKGCRSSSQRNEEATSNRALQSNIELPAGSRQTERTESLEINDSIMNAVAHHVGQNCIPSNRFEEDADNVVREEPLLSRSLIQARSAHNETNINLAEERIINDEDVIENGTTTPMARTAVNSGRIVRRSVVQRRRPRLGLRRR